MKQIKKDISFNILVAISGLWLIEIAVMLITRSEIASDYFFMSVMIFAAIFLMLAVRLHQRYDQLYRENRDLEKIKSEFTTVISHQLRTPVAAARWNMEIVMDGGYGKIQNYRIKKALMSIYRNMSTLNTGLDNLVTAAEIEDHAIYTKAVEFDFIQEMDWIIKEFLVDAGLKKIKFRLENDSEELQVKLDKHKIYYILNTLLSNALAYSNPGTTIEIKIAHDKRQLVAKIRNRGVRLNSESARLIFEKFYRTEEAKKMKPDGLGLSLFIAKVFAEIQGGQLLASKYTEAETEFTLRLPMKMQPVSAAPETPKF